MIENLKLALAALFAVASVIEWGHMREGIEEKNPAKIVGPAIAAVALGYIASECLQKTWP